MFDAAAAISADAATLLFGWTVLAGQSMKGYKHLDIEPMERKSFNN